METDGTVSRRVYVLVILAVMAGAALGSAASGRLGPVALDRVGTGLDGYMYAAAGDNGGTDGAYIFFHSLIQNTQLLLLIFACGFSVLTVPFSLLIAGIRSYCAVFTYSCIASRYGTAGTAGGAAAILVPAGLCLVLLSLSAAESVKKTVSDLVTYHGARPPEREYVTRFFYIWCGMVCLSAADAFLTPAVLAFFGSLTV